jgi:hypothetical protein
MSINKMNVFDAITGEYIKDREHVVSIILVDESQLPDHKKFGLMPDVKDRPNKFVFFPVHGTWNFEECVVNPHSFSDFEQEMLTKLLQAESYEHAQKHLWSLENVDRGPIGMMVFLESTWQDLQLNKRAYSTAGGYRPDIFSERFLAVVDTYLKDTFIDKPQINDLLKEVMRFDSLGHDLYRAGLSMPPLCREFMSKGRTAYSTGLRGHLEMKCLFGDSLVNYLDAHKERPESLVDFLEKAYEIHWLNEASRHIGFAFKASLIYSGAGYREGFLQMHIPAIIRNFEKQLEEAAERKRGEEVREVQLELSKLLNKIQSLQEDSERFLNHI